ncbi:MAG: ferritin-like domain-containing protein [Solirubrobacterales bacterium]
MTGLSRRSLLGRGLTGAGALALPGSLVAAATAQAQSDAQSAVLERLVELEQAAELGYSLAAEEGDLDAEVKSLFEAFSIHSGDRATAFSEALDQLIVDAPESSSDPAEYESLSDFDPAASQEDLLAFMLKLELNVIAAYEEDEPTLDEPDLVRSAAQMAAGHAQALVALRVAAKETGNLTALPEPSTSATDSAPQDSESDSGDN